MIILSKIFDKTHFSAAVDNVLRQRCVIEFGMELGEKYNKETSDMLQQAKGQAVKSRPIGFRW